MLTRHPALLVVAGWTLFNGLLFALLAGYGEGAVAMWLWAGSLALLAGATAAVLWSVRRGPEQHRRYRLVTGGAAAVLPAAAGAGLLGLATVYGWWMAALAVPVLALAALLALAGT
ncbi:hypothetical protein [Streptomyces aidingensis]|uniref:Uncharacterized protein n=1 Tax=Streptomyces aidingensis TaxID=910347 RepID=A0A1I1MDB4_9ACTN|nr:hypothetical protein [Streptomyces aidingensis]SFC79670.1 hypothetical protein SAMN05421773_10676 [Streptomyces aidingensis]